MPEDAATGRIHLKNTQQRALATLANAETAELTRGQYQELAGVSRSQAAYDLAELVAAGILNRVGSGRATRYRLVRETRPAQRETRPAQRDTRPAQRRWTSERIRAELEGFCAGRKTWPSAAAFKAAGRADLYVAASRYGGIGSWAVELGFPRPGRAAATEVKERSGRAAATKVRDAPPTRKFAWASAVGLASVAIVAGGVVFVVLSLPRQTVRTVAPIRIAPWAASDESSHVVRNSRTPAKLVKKTAPQAHARAARHVQRIHVPRSDVRSSSPSSSPSLVAARTYSPPSSSGSSPAAHPSSASTPRPTASAGPAPLRAPLTASGPTPLKAP